MRIFISYRRGVTSDIAGRIDDQLRQHFGEESVFRDIDNVPLGHDFHEYLSAAVVESKVFLAIIGADWLRGDLHNEEDFVRREIEAAFSARLLVIPVIIGIASLPSLTDLPPTLHPILRRQALHLDSTVNFKAQMKALIEAIEARIASPRLTSSSLELPAISREMLVSALAKSSATSPTLTVVPSPDPPHWKRLAAPVASFLMGGAIASAFWVGLPHLEERASATKVRAVIGSVAGTLPASTAEQDAGALNAAPGGNPEYAQLVNEAVSEMQHGNFQEAYATFKRAYDLSPNARVQRGLGMAAFELRRYQESIHQLEGALSSTLTPLTESLRTETHTLLTRARRYVGELTLQVKPEDALILVDGQAISHVQAARMTLDFGRHQFEISAAGHHTDRRTLAVDGGERMTFIIELAPNRPR